MKFVKRKRKNEIIKLLDGKRNPHEIKVEMGLSDITVKVITTSVIYPNRFQPLKIWTTTKKIQSTKIVVRTLKPPFAIYLYKNIYFCVFEVQHGATSQSDPNVKLKEETRRYRERDSDEIK